MCGEGRGERGEGWNACEGGGMGGEGERDGERGRGM